MKKLVLNERQLYGLIRESVNRIINENFWEEYGEFPSDYEYDAERKEHEFDLLVPLKYFIEGSEPVEEADDSGFSRMIGYSYCTYVYKPYSGEDGWLENCSAEIDEAEGSYYHFLTPEGKQVVDNWIDRNYEKISIETEENGETEFNVEEDIYLRR